MIEVGLKQEKRIIPLMLPEAKAEYIETNGSRLVDLMSV